MCNVSRVFVWRRLSRVGEETTETSGRSPSFIAGLEDETIRKVAVTPQNLAVLLEVRGSRVVVVEQVGNDVCVLVAGKG